MGESLFAKDMNDSDQPDLLRRTVESDLSDRYSIESVLGFGRVARVYRARETESGRLAALKVVPLPQRRQFAAAELFHRFEREAARASALRFSHLVPIRAFGSAPTYLWYEMDYVEAPSLARVLESAGLLELDPCLAIIDQVASALDYMHRRGVAHGNLRPTHIFVDSERWARLGDFNISRALEDLLPPDSHHDPLRVLQYVAPEAFDTRLGSPSADQYALAVVAYECLAGEPPFRADSPIGLEQLHQIAAPQPLTHVRPEIPQHVDYAIRRALSKTPHTRFANVIDFASMLHGGSWGPQRTQLTAPADVPLHAPRVLMGDPSPQRLHKLNRALSALPALASQLTRKGRDALRRTPAPQPIITRQPTARSAAPPASPSTPTIEEPQVPPTPKIDEVEVAPVIEVTEAPPSIEVTETSPVVEVTEAPPVADIDEVPPAAEVTDTPPLAEVDEAPPVADVPEAAPLAQVTEAPPEEMELKDGVATDHEAVVQEEHVAPTPPDEELEEIEPAVTGPAAQPAEPAGAATEPAEDTSDRPAPGQRPVWPAFEPTASAELQHAGVSRRQSPLQVAARSGASTERGEVSVVPRWRASLGRLAASLRRSAAGVSEASRRIEVAPALAALGAFWRSFTRLLIWIWTLLVRLAHLIAAGLAELVAAVAVGSRRTWAAAKPVLHRASRATGLALVHWSRIAGAALLRLSQTAGRVLARGSGVAGTGLLRLSKAAALALGRGSRIAGAALLRLTRAGALALGRGSRIAGAALLRLTRAGALALGRWSRSAGSALLNLSGSSGQSVLRFANRVAPATARGFAAAGRALGRGWRSSATLGAAARAGLSRVAAAGSSLAPALRAYNRYASSLGASAGRKLKRAGAAIGYWYEGLRGRIWLLRLRARMQARQREGGISARLGSLAGWPLRSYAITAAAAAALIWAGTVLLRSGPAEQVGAGIDTPESVVAAPAQGDPASGPEAAPGATADLGTPAAATPRPSTRQSQEPPPVAQQPATQEAATRTAQAQETQDEPLTAAPPARSPQEAAPSAAAPAEPARLFINSRPWGTVFIDGELIGNTPQLNVAIAPGSHVIRVVREGRQPFEREIQVAAGEELRITDIELSEEQ